MVAWRLADNINQWNRKQAQKSVFVCGKHAKPIQPKNPVSSSRDIKKMWHEYTKPSSLAFILHCLKIQPEKSKVRCKIYNSKCIWKKIEGKFHDVGLGSDFLDMLANTQATKAKRNKLDYIKLWNFVYQIINILRR